MYNNNSAHDKYTNISVTTVDRGKLLLMLYDGCIRFLKHSKAGLEAKDIMKFAKYLSKAQAIIAELMATLDFEKGGDIARDLDRIYDFCVFHLTEANIEKNPEKIGRVISIIETITSAYREIIEGGQLVTEQKTETEDASSESLEEVREAGIRIAL